MNDSRVNGRTLKSIEALRMDKCLILNDKMLNIETRTVLTLSGKRIAEYFIRRK